MTVQSPRLANDTPVNGDSQQRTTLEEAQLLQAEGFSPTPVEAGTKKPKLVDWQNRVLVAEDLPTHFSNGASIGIVTGRDGLVDIDLDCAEARALAQCFLPHTGRRWGRASARNSHWAYQCPNVPDYHKLSDPDLTGDRSTIVEVRGYGHQTVVPHSIHSSGETTTYDERGTPARVDPEDLIQRVNDLAAAVLLVRSYAPHGSRHDMALALAGALIRRDYDAAQSRAIVETIASQAGDEEWRARGLDAESTARTLAAGEPVTGVPTLLDLLPAASEARKAKLVELLGVGKQSSDLSVYRATDGGNAELLVHLHPNIRYVEERRAWFFYDGARWKHSLNGTEIEAMANQVVEYLYAEALKATDEDVKKRKFTWAFKTDTKERRLAMIRVARSLVSVSMSMFDTQRHLLNVANGTVDLRTGELLPHSQDDYITKKSPVVYDPEAKAPIYDAFRQRIMAGDVDKMRFHQVAAGYSCTGETSERVMFIPHGGGANGKTVDENAISYPLGDYAGTTRAEVLMVKDRADSCEVAALQGLRLVTISEWDEGRLLAEGRVKSLTGCDPVTARHLYGNPTTYVPEFKIWLATNHLPRVRGREDAIWSRLRPLPYTVTIPPAEQDRDLTAKLRAEGVGILRYLVEGAVQWYRNGLPCSSAVVDASHDYRASMDILAGFLGDCCLIKPGASATSSALYMAYREWCDQSGERAISKTKFGVYLKERRFEDGKTAAARIWKGLGLLAAEVSV